MISNDEVEVQQALGTIDQMTYRQFITEYVPKRDWKDKSRETSCKDGWYDWFCKDESLSPRLKKMIPMIKRIMKSSKVDPDKTYLFFKNNCPCDGDLYDDFRICDIATGDVIFTVTPSSGFTVDKHTANLWGRENNFSEPLVKGTRKDIYNFFGV